MKKFKKVLVFLILAPLIFFSGCISLLFYDENESSDSPSTSNSKIAGYKVCSKDNAYNLDDTYAIYSTYILTQLYANFGIVNDATHTSNITSKPVQNNGANYDRIRTQVSTDNKIMEVGWLWSFSRTTENCASLTTEDDPTTAESHYAVTETQTAYYNAFIDAYKFAFEYICIQIAMDIEPATFTIGINHTTGSTSVKLGSTEINEDLISSLKTEFSTKGQYVGLTTANIATLKNYILTNIIGDDVTLGYNSIAVNGATKTYDAMLTEILATSPSELEKSIFEPYPTAKMTNILGSKLYVGSSGDALGHISAMEYQSIVIMPTQDVKIYSMMLALESEYDISLTVSINYYNNTSKLTNELSSYDMNITAGKWQAKNLQLLTFNSDTIPAFTNVEDLKGDKTINNENKTSKYYTINQEAKVGILDGKNVGVSYFEVVFKINKDTPRQDNYYPFKVGIQSLFVE